MRMNMPLACVLVALLAGCHPSETRTKPAGAVPVVQASAVPSTEVEPEAGVAAPEVSDTVETPASGDAGALTPERSAQGDPFEQPPRGTSPNCGPDLRQRFAVTIRSSADFTAFLRDHAGSVSEFLAPDDFRADAGGIDWGRVAASTKTKKLGNRTVYELAFKPSTCAGFTFRITNDGYTSLYGCCGK
jgi:hypothetical protein